MDLDLIRKIGLRAPQSSRPARDFTDPNGSRLPCARANQPGIRQ